MQRLRVAKQFAKEKMGKVEKISESNDVRYCAEINEENRCYLKEIQKKLKKRHKGLQVEVEQSRLLSAALGGYAEKLASFINVQQLANCAKSLADIENTLGSLRETLNRNVLSSCQYPLGALVKSELLDAANSKAKYDKVRRVYDAACAEQKVLEEKGKKSKSLVDAENQVAEAKKEFERVGLDTLIILQITNKKTEFTVMEKLCDLFDAYDEFFAKGSAYLSQLRPQIQGFRAHTAQVHKEFDNLKDTSVPGVAERQDHNQTTSGKYFGVPLENILLREESVVPRLINNAIEYLISSGAIKNEGIFRLSGNVTSLQQLQEQADSGQFIDFNSVDDVNVVSGFLKKWLRELPDPLLTFALYEEFLKNAALRRTPGYVANMKELLTKLPPANYRLLSMLISLCVKIAHESSQNKMNATNLATVLGPNLMRPQESNPLTMMESMQSANVVIESLISLYHEFFEEVSGPPMNAPKGEDDNETAGKWKAARGTALAKAEEAKTDHPLPPMARRDSIPLPKLPPPRQMGQPMIRASKPETPIPAKPENHQITPTKPLASSAPMSPSTVGVQHPASADPVQSLSPSQPRKQEPSDLSNTKKEDSSPSAPSNPNASDGSGILSTDEEDEELNIADVDINARISREGSGIVLRRLLRATCRLSAAAGQDSYNSGHVSLLNARLKGLAQTLRDMFPVIKLYVAHHPAVKNEVIESSREVQEKAKAIILAIKQVNAIGGGESKSVITAMQEMLSSVYRLLSACEEGVVPGLNSVAPIVQQCAQHTTKILHIAFSASDENLDAHAKAALLCSEKLYHRVNIKAPEIQNLDAQKALLDATSNIEKLVNKLAGLGRKLLAESADTQLEGAIREVAKELASSFRTITTLVNTTHTKQHLEVEQENHLFTTAYQTLKEMVDNFFNEGTMLSHEIKMIDQTRALLMEIGTLCQNYSTLSSEEMLALAVRISKVAWHMDGMVEDVAAKCSDLDLVEQLHLYKRAVCHYEYLLLASLSARFLRAKGELSAFTILPAAATVSGLCDAVVPMLKDYFLASLLQAD